MDQIDRYSWINIVCTRMDQIDKIQLDKYSLYKDGLDRCKIKIKTFFCYFVLLFKLFL